jgi:hypothetical protein
VRRFALVLIGAILATGAFAPTTAIAAKATPLTFFDVTCTWFFGDADYGSVHAKLDITWSSYDPDPVKLKIWWSLIGTPGASVQKFYSVTKADKLANHIVYTDAWGGAPENIQPTMAWITNMSKNGRTTYGTQNYSPCTRTYDWTW